MTQHEINSAIFESWVGRIMVKLNTAMPQIRYYENNNDLPSSENFLLHLSSFSDEFGVKLIASCDLVESLNWGKMSSVCCKVVKKARFLFGGSATLLIPVLRSIGSPI